MLDPVYVTITISKGSKTILYLTARFRVTDQTLPIQNFRLNQNRASTPAESYYQSMIFLHADG